MRNFFIYLVFIYFLLPSPVFAGTKSEFEINMNIWNEKAKSASEYLYKAETALKNGDELEGCSNQKKAGNYGIEATQALINAFKINGNSDSEIDNLRNGLNKWKELRDFC